MPISVLMPALSPTMTEGTLAKWLKKEGEDISAGDVLAEIETDKATMEVEAVDEGKLGKILVPAGTENVPVNELIAVLLEDGEDVKSINLDSLQAGSANSNEKVEEKPAAAPATPTANEAPLEVKMAPTPQPVSSSKDNRIVASPLAKRLAKEKGINLAMVKGSGPHGRIIRRDLENFSPSAAGGAMMTAVPPRDSSGMPAHDLVKNNNMRKAIARRLQQSKQQVPHFYLTVECEIDALLVLRKSINKKAERDAQEGQKPAYKVSVNDFVIKAVAMALMEVPEANAAWGDDAVKMFKSADVAVAVAIEGGLITPIIKDAQAKSMVMISNEMKELAAKARNGQLQPAEYEGGTFSISNLGMFGIDEFSAIINPPQGAILAVGQGAEKPVVKDGQITTATLMKCTLSTDHRVIDGAVGAQFMQAFQEYIQDPAMMLI